MLARRGLTIVELLVTMAVAGIALAMIASVSLRQQRVFGDLAEQAAVAGQLREASSVLPIDLRAVSPAAGDVREARDTALELRATIASGVVCDSAAGMFVLAPAIDGAGTRAAYLTPVEAGDSLWVLSPVALGDTDDVWRAYRIAGVMSTAAGACAAQGPRLSDGESHVARTAITVVPPPAARSIGMPVRVTRPVRYSIYHASDGAWYLGEKDWSNASAKFNGIQPVAGPFLAAAGGVVFKYIDSLGIGLPSPVADPRGIALVRIELHGQTKNATRVLGAAGSAGKRADSSVVVVSLRNRR